VCLLIAIQIVANLDSNEELGDNNSNGLENINLNHGSSTNLTSTTS